MVETVIVRVTQGSLRGQKVKTEAGATYYSFHAIPYAKPPVGRLRFKVSLIFLVMEATYRCISVLLSNSEQEMQETNK
jgi:carboxylesterase type B